MAGWPTNSQAHISVIYVRLGWLKPRAYGYYPSRISQPNATPCYASFDRLGMSGLAILLQAGSLLAVERCSNPLANVDKVQAEENKQRLEWRISENEDLRDWLEGLEESILSVEGRVLSAKILGERPVSTWKSLIFTITPLIPHE